MAHLYKLFPTPLIKFEFSKHENYVFDEIPQQDRIPENWECSVNSSFPCIEDKDNFIDQEKSKSLQRDLLREITDLFANANLPTNLTFNNSFWYNIYHEEQFQERHNHINTCASKNIWSGIYYNKNATPTKFYNPSLLHRVTKPPKSEETIVDDCYHDFFFPSVEDGDVILFPSTLEHEVKPTNSKMMRLTFSFNICTL